MIADSLRRDHPFQLVLEKLELPKSTYYYHRSHPSSDKWKDVRPLVHEAFGRTPNGMGYRQVRLVLRNEQGLAITGKTVLKIMNEEGLRCNIRAERPKYNSYKGEVGEVAGNLLDRDFAADEPLKKMATDVTMFYAAGAKAYLSPVLDMFNNEVVAWQVCRSPGILEIHAMVDQLAGKPIAKDAVMHSDQGWQYMHDSYQQKLRSMGIAQSMSRKATCLDNACIEGFFGHLKDEFYRGRDFDTFEQFACELDDYIDYWNNDRYQPALGGMSPVMFREVHGYAT